MRALPAPALVAHRDVNDEARSDRYRKRGYFGCEPSGWRPRMHSPIAATALLEPIPRLPIPPKSAARFAARAFCALRRLPTRTVRKPQAVGALGSIQPSPTRGMSRD